MKRTFADIPHWRLRLLASMALTLMCWLFLGMNLVRMLSRWASPFLVANIPFFAMAFGLFLAIRFVLRTRLSSLVTDFPRIRMKPLLLGFGAYGGIHLVVLLFTLLTNATTLSYNPVSLPVRLLFIIGALVITPIQTTCEEILFRILPVRFLQGAKMKPNWLVSLLSAALFVLPHLSNIEVAHSASAPIVLTYYALFALVITHLSLHSGGFEVALGVHAANNLFVAIIANYPNSSLPSHPLFLSNRPAGTAADLIQLTLSLAVVTAVTIRPKRNGEPGTGDGGAIDSADR